MRYIHRNEWLAYGFLVVAVLAVSLPLPLFPYRWHTFLHIAGAVVFLGNIIVTAAWMLMAERTRSVNVIHFSAKAVIRADLLFTLATIRILLSAWCAPGTDERVCHGDRPLGWVGRVTPVVLDNCRPVAIPGVGTMDLHIPKLREGSYFPSLLEPRRAASELWAVNTYSGPTSHGCIL